MDAAGDDGPSSRGESTSTTPDRDVESDRNVENGSSRGAAGWARWLLHTDHEAVVFARELVSSVAAVALVGLLLFALSGVWPPMVAVESGSMEPVMERGDLVFIMDEERFEPEAAHADTGVVTAHAGREANYRSFGDYGHVVVYQPDGSQSTPIIHRAMFWVEEGENWYDEADEDRVPNRYRNCGQMPNCPAPHDGFVTKGDNNPHYDQVGSNVISSPVKPAWVIGTAELRIPWLGWVRLQWASLQRGQVATGAADWTAGTDARITGTGDWTAAAADGRQWNGTVNGTVNGTNGTDIGTQRSFDGSVRHAAA